MTELIDLSTLASLGQHFTTLQDSAEVKAAVLRVQNDLAVIKSFLSRLYGSEFSSLLSEDEITEEKMIEVKAIRKEVVTRGNTERTKKITQATSSAQVARKPPPLQRFNLSTNGSHSSSSLKMESSDAGLRSAGGDKTEKFHRNFLSMGSLNSRSSNKNGSSVKTIISSSSIGNFRNGSLTISKIDKKSISGSNLNVRIKSGNIVQNGNGAQLLKYETEYVAAEEATFNEGDDENENVMAEADAYDEFYSPEYDASGVLQEEYEETEDNSAHQLDFQEDETIYEENYDEYDMMINDSSLDVPQQHINPAILSRKPPSLLKKSNERRGSYPSTSATASSSHTSRSPQNDGNENENDGDSYTKKCKVCHEEVPSYNLFNHVIGTHYKGDVPTCEICKKTFTYRQGLISHMRYHDAGKYDKACSFCGKRFIRRSDVLIHEMRLHTGERPYRCSVPHCNQGFVRRYCLLTHVKTNHGEPYVSQIMAQYADRRKSS